MKAASLTPIQSPQAVPNPTVNNWDRDNAQPDAEYNDRLRSIEEERQLDELSRRFNMKDPTTLALNDFHAAREPHMWRSLAIVSAPSAPTWASS